MSDFNRRDFLKVTGGITAGLGAGLLASASPFRALQLAVEWSQDQLVPEKGPESIVSSECGFCESHCPIRLRMIGSRAVKSDLVKGGCARAQLVVQSIHHPDRVRAPLKRKGRKGSGEFVPASWDEVIAHTGAQIKELVSSKSLNTIASISHGRISDESALLESALFSAGVTRLYREPSLETLSAAPLYTAAAGRGVIRYDLDSADTVLSIGYDLFSGGFSRPDAANRFFDRLVSGKARYYHIGSVKNRSASCAAEFIAVKPGTEEIAAFGIVRSLMTKSAGAIGNASALSSFFKTLAKDDFERLCGVSYERLEKIASLLAGSSSPLTIAGRGGYDAESSGTLAGASILIGAMTRSFGRTAFVSGTPNYPFAGIDGFASPEPPSLAFIYEANPVHRSVNGENIAKALSRTQTVIAFSPFIDDTNRFADFIVPAGFPVPASEMMRLSPSGADMKDPCDVLRSILAAAGISAAASTSLQKETLTALRSVSADIASFTADVERIRTMHSGSAKFPLMMIPAELPSVGDGSFLAYPYAIKNHPEFLLEKEELSVWMNPATAAKYGLSNGDSISLKSERGTLEGLRVRLSNLYPTECVAVPVGFGHSGLTRYADGRGVNMKRIAAAAVDSSGFALMYATPVRIV